ncbi:MAG: endonuclease/exonuclease/phosphatase family protein [Bacteroidetes bacterium]|nr:endonuclease/exonuclease/phosphatase family protein [Bacteroidota bacterium]
MLICFPPGLVNFNHTFALNIPKKLNDVKDTSTLRVMTWNVQDFVNLSPDNKVRLSMLNLIREKNPDIICLQEMTNVEGGRWRVSVRRELDSIGFKYHFFSNDKISTNKMDALVIRGVAIFSKLPLTDSGRINIHKSNEYSENLVYANVEFNNRLVRIYTAHLASFQLFLDTQSVNKDVYQITYDRKRVIQYKLREVERLHQDEATIIHNALTQAAYPAIYCGDMNAVPCSFNYRLIKGDFNDAFIETGLGIGATFYKILPTLRIDYCFADKRLKVVNCTVIKKKLSDHYPVITDLQWK